MSWLLLTAALAATPFHGPHGQLAADVDAGVITAGDALFVQFQQVFTPDDVPAHYALPAGEGWACATGVVESLRRDWDGLSSAQQAKVRAVIDTPWADEGTDAAQPPLAPAQNRTCWSERGDNVYRSENFQIEWDTGVINQSTAQSFAAALEHGMAAELDAGWKRPIGMDGYLMQVYVSNQNYAGAFTTVRQCGASYMPYIEAGKGSFFGGVWYQDMAAHEFNHAIQFSYGFGHQFWFWEATATYVQELANPSHNEWSPYIEGYTDNPQFAMHASSQQDYDVFNHMYGLAIWDFYLDEHVGGPDLVREMWEYSSNHGTDGDLWMDDVLGDLGYDFQEAYDGFIVNNTVMDFAESDAFPGIRAVERISAVPAAGGESGAAAPQGRGQNYVRFDLDGFTEDLPDFSLRFEGDAAGAWTAWVVGVTDGAIAEQVHVELVDGIGDARLTDAARFDRLWLVVSPMSRQETSFAYSWTADAVEAEREGLAAACGCSNTSSGGFAGLPALALLLGWTRRRRA